MICCMACCRYILVERQQIQTVYVALPPDEFVEASAPPASVPMAEDPIV